MSVIFETPGHIDPKAFSTFGLNSKPNSENPIGFFGTGLKYAIAVLLREGVSIRLFIGKTEYEFYVKNTDFRDKTFGLVRMKTRRGFLANWKYDKLPFTTELGKNWKLWQAFRELESNTRDEAGSSFEAQEDKEYPWVGTDEKTQFIIDGEEFRKIYLERDSIFLPSGEVAFENETLQVLNQPSKHIYYRGLRVMDLKDSSLYTYNILTRMELTEDRTLKYEFMARHYITAHVLGSEDGDYISKIVSLRQEDRRFEYSLEFDRAETLPGNRFMSVVASRRKHKQTVNMRAMTLHNRYDSVSKSEDSLSLVMKRSKWKILLDALEEADVQNDAVAEFLSDLYELVDSDDSQEPF